MQISSLLLLERQQRLPHLVKRRLGVSLPSEAYAVRSETTRLMLGGEADSENSPGGSKVYLLHRTRCMQKTSSYCVKDTTSRMPREGEIEATRRDLVPG
jgi:hypothetical protein